MSISLLLHPISPPPHIPPSTTTSPSLSSAAAGNHHQHILTISETCSNISHIKQLHAYTLRTTLPNDSSTLFLYGKFLHLLSSSSFSDVDYAFRLFDSIQRPNRTSFMWNTLIRAFSHDVNSKQEAILLYVKMLQDSHSSPDKYTFPFVFKACAYVFGLSEGRQVHCHVVKNGFSDDVYVSNGLIHFYGSCGCLDLARKVFDEMSQRRSIVSWNSMIDANVRAGEYGSALELFREMQRVFEPDGYTMQSVLSACGGLGSLSLGAWAHAFLLRRCDVGFAMDVLIKNSLIEMYSKCGSLMMAEEVFCGMRKRDLATWNAMILAFATHGKAEEGFDCFENMVREGKNVVRPNSVTFVALLIACNHRGMVNKGRKYFDMMVKDYDIEPALEHYGCIVDLVARAGYITEAIDIVMSMPMKPDVVIWRCLLDACCKKSASVALSEEIARYIIETRDDYQSSDGNNSGAYVLLSRVYASASRWNDVGVIRKLMTEHGIKKSPGCSSIEINSVSHEFFAGDTSHPRTKQIYQQLTVIDDKLRSIGYVPDRSQAPLVDASSNDSSKEYSLKLHSERLAIAFGLISLPPQTPIRIFKNLRVCNDCHEATKLISKVFNTEIIVRDRVRFHHFKDGSCSCADYW
ncbi:unnamed protein product [Cochlearia groenlandica]